MLPLTISFGEGDLTALAGGGVAFYQLGYGIAAFGAGPLHLNFPSVLPTGMVPQATKQGGFDDND